MSTPLRPRCGKPMTRYEASNGPMLEQPECARPGSHNGPCRSSAALARNQRASNARLAELRQMGLRYGRPRLEEAA